MKGFSNKVLFNVEDGFLDFPSILQFRGVAWQEIQENNKRGLHRLDRSLFVKNNDNLLEVVFVYYCGLISTYEITLSDGSKIYCSKNMNLETEQGFKLVENLQIDDILLTSNNELFVESIIPLKDKEHMWVFATEEESSYNVNNVVSTTIKIK